MVIREVLETPVRYTPDVLVTGGGVGGIAAALAAARAGKKVLLAERGFLVGGLASAGLVTVYLPLCDGYGRQVSFGIAEELLRLAAEGTGEQKAAAWLAAARPVLTEKDPRFEVDFNPQMFAMRTERLLLDAGVRILYGTTAVRALREGDRLCAVLMENKSGRFAVCARSYVDATGDADLAAFCGAPIETFRQGNVLAAWYYFGDREGVHRNMLGLADVPDRDQANGQKIKMLTDRRFGGLCAQQVSDFMCLSHEQILSDLAARRRTDPSVEVLSIASIPQLRMTRRIVGAYTLDDSEVHTVFPDSCGMVSDWRRRGPVFEVPFRTLYTPAVRNLIFAGRCTSVTEPMWDIMRVIPCCAVTAEAAGLAAAMTDDFSSLCVCELQERLRAAGVRLHESEL